MAKEALIHELESNWPLIQLGPLSHNLNSYQQQYLGHSILKQYLYNLTLKG